MADMTAWDVAILLIAAYFAVVSLVRLMRTRRDAIVAQLQADVASQVDQERAENRRDPSRSGAAEVRRVRPAVPSDRSLPDSRCGPRSRARAAVADPACRV